MANKTINQIDNTVTSVASGDYLPIWDTSAGKTGKITRGNLVSGLQSTLTFDNYPTKNSSNPVKSSGVFATNAVIMASSKTITSAPTISSGSIIRVMFTSAITGSDSTTALSLSYNGTSYPVKVGKQGSLADFVASYVNSAYTYLQAYTTLELAFDGTQFIIIGNPVVLSSSDYTIYADGFVRQWTTITADTTPFDSQYTWAYRYLTSYTLPITLTEIVSISAYIVSTGHVIDFSAISSVGIQFICSDSSLGNIQFRVCEEGYL